MIMDSIKTKQLFIEYLKQRGKKERTIKAYSETVPNKSEVKAIIKSCSNHDDLFEVLHPDIVSEIVEKIKEQEFDIVGNRMYSAAISQYQFFYPKLR